MQKQNLDFKIVLIKSLEKMALTKGHFLFAPFGQLGNSFVHENMKQHTIVKTHF